MLNLFNWLGGFVSVDKIPTINQNKNLAMENARRKIFKHNFKF